MPVKFHHLLDRSPKTLTKATVSLIQDEIIVFLEPVNEVLASLLFKMIWTARTGENGYITSTHLPAMLETTRPQAARNTVDVLNSTM
jgi:hypothetical protein